MVLGESYIWMKSYLSDRSFTIKIKDCSSVEKLIIATGVPQGSILGPKLFVLYVNDIKSCFKNCKHFMFADDLLILSIHRDFGKATKNLQREFTNFQYWAHDKQLTINRRKTVIMHINSPQSKEIFRVKIKMHGLQCLHDSSSSKDFCHCSNFLDQVSHYKHLGLFFFL